MSSASLTQRLQALADTYKQTLNLIQELQRYPNSPLFAEDPEDKRVEVGNDIHQSLGEQEDTLEYLRSEVEDDTVSSHRRQSSTGAEQYDRNAATIARLTEDFRNARSAFRKAQLQAKRNADAVRRREREELFAGRTTDSAAPPVKRKGQEKLTQDELALNAAEDVTRSLRRAHELLAGNLAQSQFAQQTLDESSEALKGLGESYGGTTDLLKSSRGLVSQLLKSQKSDTWFLLSSMYVLIGTISWLIFRRLLYGPLWWLVYQPLKLMWWFTLVSLGSLGFGGAAVQSNSVSLSPTSGTHGIPTRQPGVTRSMNLPPKGGGWQRDDAQLSAPAPSEPTPLLDKVSEMIDEATQRIVGIAAEEGETTTTEQARNTKKRMMELEKEQERLRDEL